MPIEVLLNFDDKAAFVALQEAFSSVVSELCDVVLNNARANLGGQYVEVAATLHLNLMNLANQGLIDGQIGTDHWQAWLAEWGSGSEMDLSNPDLAAYMASEFWNPTRDGTAITGRPKGAYVGLDGQTHDQHTGTLAGRNLEDLDQYPWFQKWLEKTGLPPDTFKPKPPLHFMRDALEANRNLIIDQLNAVIEGFNFGDFFL